MYIHLSTDTAVLMRSILAVINLEAVPPQSRMVTDYIKNNLTADDDDIVLLDVHIVFVAVLLIAEV